MHLYKIPIDDKFCTFHEIIEVEYKRSIQSCFGAFTHLMIPILSQRQLHFIIHSFWHNLGQYARFCFCEILNFDIDKEKHLDEWVLHHQSRQILYTFFIMMRICNKQLFIHLKQFWILFVKC